MRRSAIVVAALAVFAAPLSWVPASAAGFDDVPDGAWYTEAVAWLAETEITSGTSKTEFSPADYVTRAQMAAFLARFGEYTGTSPKAAFDDVVDGSYYDAPVDWLLEHAITTGTSGTTYSPTDYVTRAQMAALLWRFAGRTPSVSVVPFVDVPEGTWYSTAVAWLVENAITNGTSPTTFSPHDYVSRAQMAAFLWRLAGSPDVHEHGRNRTAAKPVSGDGGLVDANGIEVVFESLTNGGYVTINVAESGGDLAALDGTVSDDVEINVSQAELDGVVTVTIPIDTVDLDSFELIVNVINSDGEWEALAVGVTTEVIDSQMYATFTLPADVPLAPTVLTVEPLALLSSAGHQRIVIQISTHAIAPPTTVPPTTTTPGEALALDVSGVPTAWYAGVSQTTTIPLSGGSGTYVEVRSNGLPDGLAFIYARVHWAPFDAHVTGTPREVGTFYATLEIEDSDGDIAVALVVFDVAANAKEADFDVYVSQAGTRYPSLSPNGRFLTVADAAVGGLRSIEVETGTTITSIPELDPRPRLAFVSEDGAHVIYQRHPYGPLTHRDVVAETDTIVAADASLSTVTPDGRWAAFVSWSVDLVGEPDDPLEDPDSAVFIWDRVDDVFTRVTPSPLSAEVLHLSDDGRYLLLHGSDLHGGGEYGLYQYDRATDSLVYIANDYYSGPRGVAMATDGSAVYYVAALPASTNGAIFVWDRATTTSIQVTTAPAFPWQFGRLQTTVDGGHLTFASSVSTLVLGDENGRDDVFTWDRDALTMQRISEHGLSPPALFEPFVASLDGSVVLWESNRTDLAETDFNGSGRDIFMWDRNTDTVQRVTNSDLMTSAPSLVSRDGGIVVLTRFDATLVWRRDLS